MGTAPITPPKSETPKESNIPISEKDTASKTGAYPSNTILIGVFISVIVGTIILIYKHYKNKKSKSTVDNSHTGDASNSSSPAMEDATKSPDVEEQTLIEPDTEQHEEISKRFAN